MSTLSRNTRLPSLEHYYLVAQKVLRIFKRHYIRSHPPGVFNHRCLRILHGICLTLLQTQCLQFCLYLLSTQSSLINFITVGCMSLSESLPSRCSVTIFFDATSTQ